MNTKIQLSDLRVALTEEEERHILIDKLGMSEAEANFYLAIGRGESEGDVIALSTPHAQRKAADLVTIKD